MARKNKTRPANRAGERSAALGGRTGVVSGANSRRLAAPKASPLSFLPSPFKKLIVKPTRLDTFHSRDRSEATRLSLHLDRVAAMPVIAEKHRTQSKLSLIATEPDKRKSSEKAREALHCKKRPDSKKAARSGKGGGVNKRFVPWC